MNDNSFLQRHPLTGYFVLAYAISWSLILIILVKNGIRFFHGENILEGKMSSHMLWVWLAMLAGPSTAGILSTLVADGKQGVISLARSVLKFKMNIRWYLLSLLLFPVLLLTVFSGLYVIDPRFHPHSLLFPGIAGGLITGFFEEMGWTGFALPALLKRYSLFNSAVILGVIHAFWHVLGDVTGSLQHYGSWYALHFFLWIVALVSFRSITSWIYVRTKSVFAAQLSHASFTGSQVILTPATLTAREDILWYACFTVAVLILAFFVVRADKHLFFSNRKSRS